MKRYLFVTAFFVFAWFAILFFNVPSGQHFEFVKWVKEEKDYCAVQGCLNNNDWYNYPAMKYIGSFGYSYFGDIFFLAFPFLLMLGSITFLLLLCKEFGFNPLLFLLVFLPVSFSIREFGFFTHDTPQFFLCCAFAYYFFKTLYSDDTDFLTLFVIAGLSLFFRESGIIFLGLAFCLLASKKIIENNRLLLFLPLVFEKTFKDLVYALNQGASSFQSFNPYALFKYFNNPVFGFSFIISFFCFEKWHFLIILITFIYTFSVANNPIYYGSVFRYTLPMMPLQIFYVLRFFQQVKFK